MQSHSGSPVKAEQPKPGVLFILKFEQEPGVCKLRVNTARDGSSRAGLRAIDKGCVMATLWGVGVAQNPLGSVAQDTRGEEL